MKRRALFVGIDNYTGGIPALSCAQNDALELRNVFADLGYDAHVFRNAEAHALLDKIDELTSDLTRDDLFLFFFAGHGYTDKNAQRRLACKGDTKFRIQIGADGIGLDELRKITNPAGCRRIFILDACQVMVSTRRASDGEICRDPFTKRDVEAVSRIAERSDDESCAPIIVINSCSTGEVAYEFDGHGLFTHALLDVVKSVCNSDAAFDRELVALVNEHMRKASKGCCSQTPQYYGEEENAIAIPLLPTAQDVIDTRASQHNNGESVETLIDEREQLDWYEQASLRRRILEYIRVYGAMAIIGPILYLGGNGGYSSLNSSLRKCITLLYVISWGVLIGKSSLIAVIKFFFKLLHGEFAVNLKMLLIEVLRFLGGSMLLYECGLICFFTVATILALFGVIPLHPWTHEWGQCLHDWRLWVAFGPCIIGGMRLGTLLFMKRHIRANQKAIWKWFLISVMTFIVFLILNKSTNLKNWQRRTSDAEAAIRAFKLKDYENAWRLVEYADASDVRLIAYIADAYYSGNMGVSVDYEKAITNYKKLLGNINESKEPVLFYCIGECYRHLGIYCEAFSWFNKAASAGHERAYLRLGEFYEVGNSDIRRNETKALLAYSYVPNSKNAEVKAAAEKAIGRLTKNTAKRK